MQKNDIFEMKIEDMSTEGLGIGHAAGMAVFVKDTVIGDTVRVKAVKVKKNYAFGRAEEILTPSAQRVEPVCPVARACGGCQLQAMDYQAQLAFKTSKVRNNLVRLGGFDADFIDGIIEPCAGMEKPFRYRNKAQFPVGLDKNGNLTAGFYAGRTHDIIPSEDCLLGTEENKDIIDLVLAHMKENNIKPYNEETGKGLVRHILIRKGFTSGQIMVCLILNGKKMPGEAELAQKLQTIPGMTSFVINTNLERSNVILGRETRTIWGEDTIEDSIGNVRYKISARSFYQVNPVQTEVLYGTALEYAGLNGGETVWDLYCGIGTISLFLAQKAGQVYGVEIVPEAIEDAGNNAKLNGFENAKFFVGKAEDVLPEKYKSEGIHADVIVVDPPRKGCDAAVLETMTAMQPEKIVYVSCDSATLARDLKILCENGYKLEKVQPVDMFPMTVHVETVVLMSKVNPNK